MFHNEKADWELDMVIAIILFDKNYLIQSQ